MSCNLRLEKNQSYVVIEKEELVVKSQIKPHICKTDAEATQSTTVYQSFTKNSRETEKIQKAQYSSLDIIQVVIC